MTIFTLHNFCVALMACFVALAASHTQAQTSSTGSGQAWPARPVRVVVPFPAGGPADVLGRVMAARFTESLKQQFVVDNRPGANGNIGANVVAKAANDGYTIMFATTGPLALNRLMYKTTPYDPMRDFAPVSLFADMPLIIANDWLASTEGANRLRDMGARPIGGTPADLGAFVRSEYAKWQPVVEPIAAALQ